MSAAQDADETLQNLSLIERSELINRRCKLTTLKERSVSTSGLSNLAPAYTLTQSVVKDPCAMAVSITQADYDSLISRLAAVEEENAATLLEVDT